MGGASLARAQAENGKINQAQAAAVEQTIQEVRRLKLKDKVPVEVRSTEEAGKLLEAELESEYTPESIETDGRAGALIGLYPPGVNLKAANMSLLESQVIAFYDFKKKTMVIVNGALEREFPGQPPELQSKLDGMILAHEFTARAAGPEFRFRRRATKRSRITATARWRCTRLRKATRPSRATPACWAAWTRRSSPR